MTIEFAVKELSRSAALIREFVAGTSPEDQKVRPHPDKWAMVEVIGHLLLEERADFRLRMDYLINKPGIDFPPLDVDAAVRAGQFLELNPREVLAEFMDERTQSIHWLHSLKTSDLASYADHPQAGRLHSGDLLASWLAHDVLHLRQLLKIHFHLLENTAKPYGVAYAGGW